MVVSSLEAITAKLVQKLQGGQSSKQEDSKQIEQLQQLQHFFDQQQECKLCQTACRESLTPALPRPIECRTP
jgi:hypothetical protein